MTWTVTHTLPGSTGAENHAALVYLFDTFLPTRAGSATGAHPDASVFKRKFSRTTTNMIGGGSYVEYFWVNWGSSTAPTTLNMYRDGTYTSTPGDLCTDVTNLIASTLPTGVNGSWRFWTSDQNPRAALMTKGKSVVYWEPGFETLASYDRGGWTGTTATCLRSFTFPFASLLSGWRVGPPHVNTGTSTSEYYWGPALGVTTASTGYYGTTDRIEMNVPFMAFDNASSSSPTTGAEIISGGVGNDVGFFRPGSPSDTSRFIGNSGTGATGLLMLASGRYYLLGRAITTHMSMVWDMGTSEPDLS